MFNVWSQAVKKRGKWTLDAIARSIYIIARHVQDHQEKLLAKGEGVSTNSTIIALILMYSFFITKINLAEAIRQLQNKAAAMISNSSSRSRSQQSHFHQTSNTVQAMYAFYVCADEEDFIVSKSFTSDQRSSKPSQT
jgi:hypothetical protein